MSSASPSARSTALVDVGRHAELGRRERPALPRRPDGHVAEEPLVGEVLNPPNRLVPGQVPDGDPGDGDARQDPVGDGAVVAIGRVGGSTAEQREDAEADEGDLPPSSGAASMSRLCHVVSSAGLSRSRAELP